MTRTDASPVPSFADLLRLDGRGVVLADGPPPHSVEAPDGTAVSDLFWIDRSPVTAADEAARLQANVVVAISRLHPAGAM